MKKQELIIIREFCEGHQIDTSFILTLRDRGFIQIIEEDQSQYLTMDQLPTVEKILRFHEELEINLEGIEVILNLLDKIEQLQEEGRVLQQKLSVS